MEDALAQVTKADMWKKKKVLILVVMEDALAQIICPNNKDVISKS